MSRSLLYKSAFILGISSLLSRVLGVVRDHLLARFFGAGGEGIYNLDVYYAAFRLPDFIYALLIMGTVAAAFVPILTGVLGDSSAKKMTKAANLFTSNVLNVIFLSVFVVSAIGFICAPWLVGILVPGFAEADFNLTVSVTRLMLISPLFFGMSSVLQSVQNTFDRFFYYAMAPVLYNLGIIGGILWFAQDYGVWAVAGGVIVGAFLHFLIQLPGVRGLGFQYKPFVSFKDSHLREMIRLVIPRIVGMSVMQVNLIFDTIVGSLLAAGSITVLNYAVNLNSLPMGMVGVSFAIASFATLSSLALKVGRSGCEEFAAALSKVVTSVLYFVLPAAVGLFVLRFEIVGVVLGYGEFSDESVILTANTLAFFLIGLVGQSLVPVFARAFYAYKNTVIPVTVSVLAMALNIGLNFYFAFEVSMGVYGIAFATSIAALFNLLLLILFLRSQFLGGVLPVHLGRVGAIVCASVAMGVAVYFVNGWFAEFALVSSYNQILALLASIVIGVVVFVVAILPFGLDETKLLLNRLHRRS